MTFTRLRRPRRRLGEPLTPGILISRTPNRLTNLQPGWILMKTQAIGSSIPKGGRWKTGNRRTILYVDDNPKALRMLKFVIEGSGYKVVAARDAGEGLDLSLVNYRILKMMGSDPILAIKRFSPGTPIVLVSGYALLPPQEFSHVDAHVGKGATLDILLDKIRALVVAHESSPAAASGSLEKRNETKLSA